MGRTGTPRPCQAWLAALGRPAPPPHSSLGCWGWRGGTPRVPEGSRRPASPSAPPLVPGAGAGKCQMVEDRQDSANELRPKFKMKEISFFGLHLTPRLRSENDGTAPPGSSPTPAGLADPGTDTRAGGGRERDQVLLLRALRTPGAGGGFLPGQPCSPQGPCRTTPASQLGHPWGASLLFPQHRGHSEAPSSCQIKNTKPNWTQTQIKERHTRREGPVGPSRSLASQHDTFLCNSGTEALGPLWGVGVKKYRDSSLPVGSKQGRGRPNLNFSFWFHV